MNCKCGKQVKSGHKRCEGCLISEKERAAKKRAFRKANGFCIQCDNPVKEGFSRCDYHLEQERQKKTKYRQRGKCLSCGGTTNGQSCCSRCLEIKRQKAEVRRTLRRNNGLCIDCGVSDRVEDGCCCVSCYLRRTAKRYFGDRTDSEKLMNLFDEQQGKCPYSGRALVIGSNSTELDHKVCMASGGEQTIQNLQWVNGDVNRMKWTLPEAEFLGLVKEIYEHCELHKWITANEA